MGAGGGLHVKDEVKDEARRKGAIGCLDETWFALALAGSSDTDTEPTDEGGGVVARLYWRLLRDTNTDGVKGMDSGRMQTLGAVAFAPGLVRVLWSYLSEALPASRELPMADSGPGAGVGVWTAPTLTRGVYDVSDVDVPALGAVLPGVRASTVGARRRGVFWKAKAVFTRRATVRFFLCSYGQLE